MENKLTETLASNDAIDALASALIALPGGEDALDAAIANYETTGEDSTILE